MVKIITFLILMASLVFGVVNVNKATSAQLETLKGIGPSKAAEIIKYRKAHNGFKSVDELVNVKGIGPKTVQGFRSEVSVR